MAPPMDPEGAGDGTRQLQPGRAGGAAGGGVAMPQFFAFTPSKKQNKSNDTRVTQTHGSPHRTPAERETAAPPHGNDRQNR